MNKPLLMADLPGRVHICKDGHDTYKPKNVESVSSKLEALGVGYSMVIPMSSRSQVSRVAMRNGLTFKTVTIDGGQNLRVLRIR